MEENTRLTDLTRMLLSSQAFSGFLSELSGTAPSSSASDLLQPQPQPKSQLQLRKDINPHQVPRQLQNQKQQQQQQIGMATIPERPADFSLADNITSASSWNTTIGLNNFPVYSLTEVPAGPAFDIESLSGKADTRRLFHAQETTKIDMPTFEHAPFLLYAEELGQSSCPIHRNADVGLDETSFPLYSKPSLSRSEASTRMVFAAHCPANPKQVGFHFDLHSHICETEAAVTSRLELMCSRLDGLSARIAAVTSHLD